MMIGRLDCLGTMLVSAGVCMQEWMFAEALYVPWIIDDAQAVMIFEEKFSFLVEVQEC